jgi:hypothetical protein
MTTMDSVGSPSTGSSKAVTSSPSDRALRATKLVQSALSCEPRLVVPRAGLTSNYPRLQIEQAVAEMCLVHLVIQAS